MKDTTAYVWLEDIFNNKYKCKCGYKLCVGKVVEENGELFVENERDVMVDQYDNSMYCPKCGEFVGYVDKIGLTDMERGEYAHWPVMRRRIIAYARQKRDNEVSKSSKSAEDGDS